MGIGLLITPLGLLYSDIAASVPIVLQILFFVTPVVYRLPDRMPFSLMAVVNPVTPLLNAARGLIARGGIPNPESFAALSLIAVGVLLFAWLIYRLALPILIERMSA
jgi:lipopolysaccharide transport system permease protein